MEIASAEPGPGAAAGVVPWAIVKDVAPGIFGQCTSVAAAKGGHASGTRPTVLLRHSTSGCFLAASQRNRSFRCQKGRPNSLNANSWEACGITTQTTKSFPPPSKGFVVGTTITYDGQLYKVAGFSSKGWLPQWNAIVKGE